MSIGDKVRMAIEIECTSIKAGNVHPLASFQDLCHEHFIDAAKAIGVAIDQTLGEPVGKIVLRSVRAMMDSEGTNTSLGTILLMAPLVEARYRMRRKPFSLDAMRQELVDVLSKLTPNDSSNIYEAIQIAKPGGLGSSDSMDVRLTAPASIMDAMQIAAQWDDVAFQYASCFELVFDIADRLATKVAAGLSQYDAVRWLQMELLSERIDSLIARKQGKGFAEQVRGRAKEVIASGPFGSEAYQIAWSGFDKMLRDDKHAGNPGTIADLIAAALFVL